MWYYLITFLYLSTNCQGDYSPNFFCADLGSQPHVDIELLMGMWYGVEIINHKEERRYKIYSSSCPVIHISEYHPSSTISPLYKQYNQSYYGYGRGGGYGTPLPSYAKYPQEVNRQYLQEIAEYDRRTTYSNHPLTRRLYNSWGKTNGEMKHLRLYWDENSDMRNWYHLKYTESRQGLWISSGPEDGVAMDARFSHFAGTVQVLKAVGNHLVLTFCHRVPEHQLYTVILSREVQLENTQVHNIHGLLLGKGLSTHAIKRVCKNSCNKMENISLSLVLILSLICKLVGFM